MIRASKELKDKVRIVSKIFNEKTKTTDFRSEEYILDILCNEYMKDNGVDMSKPITRQDISIKENIITKNGRLDNNFSVDLKNTLKNLSRGCKELGITVKKLDYDELIFNIIEFYVEKHPELEPYMLEDRFIKRSMELHEIVKQRRGY